MNGQEKKLKVIELLNKVSFDRKKKLKTELIAIDAAIVLCEPVLKKHYEIASQYGVWDNGWRPEFKIYSISEQRGIYVILKYKNPYCPGVQTIPLSLDWFNDEDYNYEMYRLNCRSTALERIEENIVEVRKHLNLLEEEYKRIESMK